MNDYKYSNKVFIERASDLIFNSGKTQTELVEILGLSNGSIANLKNKKVQTPSAETVCVLAKYFNVSTDWLLGLTDVKSTDKATKELCDTLGLSEEAIDTIQEKTEINNALNFLFYQHQTYKKHYKSNDFDISILENLSKFIEIMKTSQNNDTFFKISKDGELVKGELIYDTENGEVFANDVVGVMFEYEKEQGNNDKTTPIYCLSALRMQELLNEIMSQLQFYIKLKVIPGFNGDLE